MMKKVLFAALIVLALAAAVFALLYDWDEPSRDPRMMGGPHLGPSAQAQPREKEEMIMKSAYSASYSVS